MTKSAVSAVTALAMAGAFAAALVGATPSAHATFILGTGNIGGLGDNVIGNACVGNIAGPAALVQGCLNTSHTTLLDVSTASGDLVVNGGQARFEQSGGNLDDFTIKFAGSSLGFSGIVFNINAQSGTTSNVSFVVDAVNSLGNPEAPQTFTNTISGAGNNFFNLTTPDGEVALSVSVTSTLANIVDIRQIRVAAQPIPGRIVVPEPATLGLVVAGLLGAATIRRRPRP